MRCFNSADSRLLSLAMRSLHEGWQAAVWEKANSEDAVMGESVTAVVSRADARAMSKAITTLYHLILEKDIVR